MGERSPRDGMDDGGAASRGPLDGLRVLDLGGGPAVRFCTKVLGDLGADVVAVSATIGGAGAGSPGAERALDGYLDLYLATSKRSAVLDSGQVRRLVAEAGYDIVVADGPLPPLNDLRAGAPQAIVTTISGFGSDGPYRDYQADHLVLSALSGQAVVCGLPDRPPLQAPGHLHELVTGVYAAVATLAAALGRDRHGRGEHIDVSAWESAITIGLLPTLVYDYWGVIPERRSDRTTGPSFNLACAEGYVGTDILTETHWQMMCALIDRFDLPEDSRFADPYDRVAHGEELRLILTEALAARRAEEVFHQAQEWRIPFGLIVSPRQVLELEPHRERGFFVELEEPAGAKLRLPRPPFLMPASPARPFRPPRPGEHTAEILTALDTVDASRHQPSSPPAPPSSGAGAAAAPLAGLKIVDLTMFMAGPLVTLLAADLGAEVIKVESCQRIDGWRAAGRDGDEPWETAHCFNWINRSKQGITLNLADPRGRELLLGLVAEADAVIENYTPRVLDNFNLGYDVLAEVNPRIVLLSMPGFGVSGPWRDYAAFAWTTEQTGGMCHLTGYEDGPPLFSATTGGDPLAGVWGGVALLAALRHQQRTGQGQWVDLSQAEATTTFIGDVLVEAQLEDTDPGRRGNRHPRKAPHNMYRCRDGGWIAISCGSDEEWAALCRQVGDDPARARFTDLAARRESLDALDEVVAGWAAERDAGAWWHALQAAGVTAGQVLDGRMLLADPHLAAREFQILQDRATIGVKHYPAQPFHFADAPLPAPTRAPYLGEFTRQVLSAKLGLSDARLDELEADLVIGTRPVGL